jgi:hypothetical protein
MTKTDWKRLWIKDLPGGDREYRMISKVLFAVVLILIPAVIYGLLLLIEEATGGPMTILVLAYGVIVLMVAVMLVVVILSLIDYLNRFE